MTHPLLSPSGGGPRSSFERALAAARDRGLAVRMVRPSEAMISCPVHDDSTPSCHLTWSRGVTLAFCHGCQAAGRDVADGLGLTVADLYDEPLPPRDRDEFRSSKSVRQRRAGQRRGRVGRLPDPITTAPKQDVKHRFHPVETYVYLDHDGTPIAKKTKELCDCCTPPRKNFPQQYRATNGRWGLKSAAANFTEVLYRAPDIDRAIAAGAEIWLLEGEKDVHTAEGLGLVATTAASSSAFPDQLAALLAAVLVNVVLDRDLMGYQRGVLLHDKITAAGGRVNLFLPATTEPKSDFTDHVQAGFAVDQLVPVSFHEVAAWAEAADANEKLITTALPLAVAEVDAHLELAQNETDPHTSTHRRFAQRWVHEADLRFEALTEAAHKVRAHAVRAGTPWAAEALDRVDEATQRTLGWLRRIHATTGVALPAALEQEPQPAGDTEPSTDPATPTRFAGAEGSTVRNGVFRIVDNAIVQWESTRGSDDDETRGKFKTILSLAVTVVAREFKEDDDEQVDVKNPLLKGRESRQQDQDLNPTTPRILEAVVIEYIEPATGEVVRKRVTYDRWHDHSWLESLPGNPDYDHRRSGTETVQRAVLAVSTNVQDTVRYTSTGWRKLTEDRYGYVHAGGIITRDGNQSARTGFSGALARFDLPDPTTDARRLRDVFHDCSAVFVDQFPARITVPLLGHVFRAVLGPNEWTLTLVGTPASFKTSLAAKMMHHFGEAWDRDKPGSSVIDEVGDTGNATRIKAHAAKDALYWLDDFVSGKGPMYAQKNLDTMLRMMHNHAARDRATRDGQSVSGGTPPRTTVLATSEVPPRPGSAAQRTLLVPLHQGDLDATTLFGLDSYESRYGRALLMASYLQWLAEDFEARRLHYLEVAEHYAAHVTTHLRDIVKAASAERAAAALGELWAGWVALADFLTDRQAITTEERDQWLATTQQALLEAAEASVDPDIPGNTGGRVLEMLRFALRTGLCHALDVTTGQEPPEQLARRLGWIQTVQTFGNDTRTRWDRKGQLLGWVRHAPDHRHRQGRILMCEGPALEAAIKSAANALAEGFAVDRSTIVQTLHDIQVLVPSLEGTRTRMTAKCTIDCDDTQLRVYRLLLDRVLGDEEPEPGQPDHPNPPAAPRTDPAGTAAAAVQLPDPAAPGDEQPPPTTPAADQDPALAQEEAMAEPLEIADREGVLGLALNQPKAQPCLLCGQPCVLLVDGLVIHYACWVSSTQAQRTAAQQPPAAPIPGPQPPAEPHHHTPPPTALRGPAATPAAAFRAAAAVVDTAAVHLTDGSSEPHPWPLDTLADLVRLSAHYRLGYAVTDTYTLEGQIWLQPDLVQRLGIDLDQVAAVHGRERDETLRALTAGTPLVNAALDQGWQLGRSANGGMTRWTRLWKDDQRVAVVITPAFRGSVEREDDGLALLEDNPDADTLARRLQRLNQALGYEFHVNPNTTGQDMMKALRIRNRDAAFAPLSTDIAALRRPIENDPLWARTPTAEEHRHRYVMAFDKGGQYVSAAGSATLGIGEPLHHPDGTPWVKGAAGLYLIDIPDEPDWRYPNVLDPQGRSYGLERWVTAPSLEISAELGFDPPVKEAWVWPSTGRVLSGYSEHLAKARTVLDVPDDPDAVAARNTVKQIYTQSIGMLGSHTYMKGKAGYRPDWWATIVAKAKANLIRNIVKIGTQTGRWPVAVTKDTVVYTTDELDPAKAWPGDPTQLGRGLGKYKFEGYAPLEDHLRWLKPGQYRGKSELFTHLPE